MEVYCWLFFFGGGGFVATGIDGMRDKGGDEKTLTLSHFLSLVYKFFFLFFSGGKREGQSNSLSENEPS